MAETNLLPSDPPWLKAAFNEIGVKEVSGRGSNPRIEEYLRTGTTDPSLIDDDVPWCAGFMNWALIMGTRGTLTPLMGTRSLMAKSFRNYGRPVGKVRGAIAVFDRPPNPASGHVGILLGWGPGWVDILGGNQSNMVTITRYSDNLLIELRWPNSYPLPGEAQVPPDSIPETPIAAKPLPKQPTTSTPRRPQASPPPQPSDSSPVALLVVLIAMATFALIMIAKDKMDVLDKIKDMF